MCELQKINPSPYTVFVAHKPLTLSLYDIKNESL
jgi:hypothetical protein